MWINRRELLSRLAVISVSAAFPGFLHSSKESTSALRINADRLRELGRVSREWSEEVKAAFRHAESDERTVFTTPLVLEVIAERQ